jgi:hypothetical protein
MTLHSTAQTMPERAQAADPMQVVLYPVRPSKEVVLEMHEPDTMDAAPCPSEVVEPGTVDIVVDELPGVETLDPVFEQSLEVNDNDTVESNRSPLADDNAARKTKKDTKKELEAIVRERGTDGLVEHCKARLDGVPKHSGKDVNGCHRAISYLDHLADDVSWVMRNDLDGALDADKVEKICAELDDGRNRLEERIEKLTKSKKRKKKSDVEPALVKEAQKAPTITGIVITVPLLISRLARVIINGTVSAGHDSEVMARDLIKKYDLNVREQSELIQHLEDLGFPILQDRGYLPDEDVDRTRGQFDWMTQYQS